MRKALSLVVVASLVAVSMSASAGGAIDLPRVDNARRDDGYSKVTVKCWQLQPNGPRARVSCAVAETVIKVPDRAEAAKDSAEMAKVPDAELLKGCAKIPLAASMPMADAHDRAILEAGDRACAAHDGPAMRRAVSSMLAEIAPVSCTVETTQWYDLEVFEQIDGNTWIESQGPHGTCNISSTLTLARKPNDVWTFALAETSPGNSSDPMCKQTTNHRWSAVGMGLSRTACKYVH